MQGKSSIRDGDFLRHQSSIDDFPETSHYFAIIIYLNSPINHELKPTYRAEQSGPDQMLLPAQPEALENVCRVIMHYLNMN